MFTSLFIIFILCLIEIQRQEIRDLEIRRVRDMELMTKKYEKLLEKYEKIEANKLW